jgi:hypothetical protein
LGGFRCQDRSRQTQIRRGYILRRSIPYLRRKIAPTTRFWPLARIDGLQAGLGFANGFLVNCPGDPSFRLPGRTAIPRPWRAMSAEISSSYPFFFNGLHTTQCAIVPLNLCFSPFVDICVCFPRVFNNIRMSSSIRRQTLTGAPRVKLVRRLHQGSGKSGFQPGNPRNDGSLHRGIRALESENACISR